MSLTIRYCFIAYCIVMLPRSSIPLSTLVNRVICFIVHHTSSSFDSLIPIVHIGSFKRFQHLYNPSCSLPSPYLQTSRSDSKTKTSSTRIFLRLRPDSRKSSNNNKSITTTIFSHVDLPARPTSNSIMFPTKNTLMAAALAFAFNANAHMIMSTPKPYGVSSINSSPLMADGSDFPCKQRPGVYDAEGASNIMPIGVNQTLSFKGGATHGGGSCQISLTKDKQPSKSSKWMVIHSIIGGCPASASGNQNSDPNSQGATKFEYSIPQGIAAGDYTLAWTWFNKIGNREMYMNCAPVTVTGGSKKRDEEGFSKRDTSLPDMFVANVPATDCTTKESTDVEFPNPGSSVEKSSQGTAPPSGPKCGAASGGSSSSGSSGSSGSPSAASAPQPSSSGGVFAAGASSASGSAPAPSSAPAVAPPVASAAPSAAPAPAVAPGNTSSSSSSGSAPADAPAPATGSSGAAGSSPCSSPGTEVCSPDGTKIGMCDPTSHVVFQPVAGGTKCVGGQMVVAKRSAKFAGRGRVRRSSSSGAWGFQYDA